MLIGTFTISGSPFTITKEMGIQRASIKAVGGTISVAGTMILAGLTSTAQEFADGDGVTVGTDNQQFTSGAIEDLTITPLTGTASLFVTKI